MRGPLVPNHYRREDTTPGFKTARRRKGVGVEEGSRDGYEDSERVRGLRSQWVNS